MGKPQADTKAGQYKGLGLQSLWTENLGQAF